MTNESKPARKLPRRIWPRFTLRVLLMIVTVFCLGLGWWTYRAREQRRVVERIRFGLGIVEYENNASGNWIPQIVVNVLGSDFFYSVRSVATSDLRVLSNLKYLRRLERISIVSNDLGDADVVTVACLSQVRLLNMEASSSGFDDPLPRLTDRALEQIASMANLEYLRITGSQFTRRGIEHLERAPKLCSGWVENATWERTADGGHASAGSIWFFRQENPDSKSVTTRQVVNQESNWFDANRPPVVTPP